MFGYIIGWLMLGFGRWEGGSGIGPVVGQCTIVGLYSRMALDTLRCYAMLRSLSAEELV